MDARGPGGEELGIDLAVFGSPSAKRVVLHTTGLHGIEGFAGSAIQLALLERGLPAIPDDGAIVLVHVLNPFGMAWLRRVNESNVDLNRNFLEPDEEYASPAGGYAAFDGLLNPKTPPSLDLFYAEAAWLVARHGFNQLKQTIVGGQYAFEKGLFFGGAQLEQGPALFSSWVEEQLGASDHVVAIDVHTGLGKSGVDTLLVEDEVGGPLYERLKARFGERVTPWDPDAGVAYAIRGGYPSMIPRACERARVDLVTQEFGTTIPFLVLKALREENRWHQWGDATLDHPAKARLKDTFCKPTPTWKSEIVRRGLELFDASVDLTFGEHYMCDPKRLFS